MGIAMTAGRPAVANARVDDDMTRSDGAALRPLGTGPIRDALGSMLKISRRRWRNSSKFLEIIHFLKWFDAIGQLLAVCWKTKFTHTK